MGPDYTMRSASRFLIERSRRLCGAMQQAIGRSRRYSRADTEAGLTNSGTGSRGRMRRNRRCVVSPGQALSPTYRGQEILASWAPLKLNDLNWAIVGKIDLDEAYAPIQRLAKGILIQTVIILVVITLVVMLLGDVFCPSGERSDRPCAALRGRRPGGGFRRNRQRRNRRSGAVVPGACRECAKADQPYRRGLKRERTPSG